MNATFPTGYDAKAGTKAKLATSHIASRLPALEIQAASDDRRPKDTNGW